VKEQVRAIPQRGVGYGLLRWLSADAQVRERMAELETAEVSFNYLGQLDQVLEEGSVLSVAPESVGATRSPEWKRRHLLEVGASVEAGSLQVVWAYSEQVHERETIVRVAERYLEALRRIIAHCLSVDVDDRALSDFSNEELTDDDLENIFEQISEAWNVTQ
jgi:microcystin synthetase protein McyA